MSDKLVHVVFPLFDGMTALDFAASYQVFSREGSVALRTSPRSAAAPHLS